MTGRTRHGRSRAPWAIVSALLLTGAAFPLQAAVPPVPVVAPEQSPAPNTRADQQDIPADTAPPPAQDAQPRSFEPVPPDQAIPVLGKKVHGPDGKDIVGAIVDVVVDDQGRPRAAIIDFGGFLGVGSRKIAVDWQALKFRPADRDAPLVLDLDRDQIQAAPEYKYPTQPAKVVEPSAADTPTDGTAPGAQATHSAEELPATAPTTPDAEKHDH